MCGITGIFAYNEIGRINMINLAKATQTLDKRGPDNKGIFTSPFVSLGHQRLSIIDTSSHANQPLADESQRYIIVYNGEIYNYRALKKDLESKGIVFKTNSDTEVVLQLFIHEGENALKKLNGFFAFAIYDKEKEEIFIARDRLGIKPLYYYEDEDKFLFASEMKAIIKFGIHHELNPVALNHYFRFNYIPAPETILNKVYKLLPGHFIRIKKGAHELKQYYDIPYNKEATDTTHLNYEQQQEKLKELLEESVQKRMISDVPLGSFLSGGIDSSVIASLAARHTNKLSTFSVGYKDEPFFDETQYANLVAKKIGSEHTVFSLSNDDLFSELHKVLEYIDEPFADSSAIPVYLLSKFTREHVTVALSGDGADEIFSGYNKHKAFYLAQHPTFSSKMAESLGSLWDILPKSRNGYLSNKVRQLKRFTDANKLSRKEQYWQWASLSDENYINNLIKEPHKAEASKLSFAKEKILQQITNEGDINEILLTDTKLILPYDMLTKVDLMSMANSLEVRVPFLDHELVKFAFSLPEESKINHDVKKKILQDTYRDILPKELYHRPKHGFEVPLLKWFRTDLKSMIEDDLLKESFIEEQNIFNYEAISNLKKRLFSNNPGDAHAHIWALIVFQSWWKKFFNI